MENTKITKRDIKFFLFGVLFMFLIVLIYEWHDFKRGCIDGAKDTEQIQKQ